MAQPAQQVLNDLFNNIGTDLSVSSTGDLLLASGLQLSEQRVLRRLLTAINGYIWDTTFGASLPSFVGQPGTSTNVSQLTSLITSQIFLEDTVAKYPAPVISLQPIQQGLFCQITYTYIPTNQPIVLTFTV